MNYDFDDTLGTMTIYGDNVPLELVASDNTDIHEELRRCGFEPSVAGPDKSWDRRVDGTIARVILADLRNGIDYGLVVIIHDYRPPKQDPAMVANDKIRTIATSVDSVLAEMPHLFAIKEANAK